MAPRLKILISILAGLITFSLFLTWAQNYNNSLTSEIQTVVEQNVQLTNAPPIPKNPRLAIYKKDKNTLIVAWEDMPEGTTGLDIYRRKIKTGLEDLWKSFDISGPSGSQEIKLGPKETTDDFTYRGEATSATGGTIWQSPEVPPQEITATTTIPGYNTPAPVTPTTPDSSGGTTPPGATNPTTTIPVNPTNPTPTTTPTTTTPGGGQTTLDPNSIYFYSPSQQISGSLPLNTEDHFRAQHLNNKINIWWRDLPSETDNLIIRRAGHPDGPWVELLRQNNPNINEGSLSLVDLTLTQTQYYKLEAKDGSSIIVTYGPVQLQELQ